jgi:GNAT superfamily N-acetyltransferase
MLVTTKNEIEFRGYFPGAVGLITHAHAVYYHEHWGFDVTFETQVGRELSEFVARFREGRDGLWVARVQGAFAGSVAIDGREAETDGARLRWFIVLPPFQGTGLGKALLGRAVEFCRQGSYPGVYLWTFQGLEAARTLYERHGFRLCEEHGVDQWGRRIIEQRFELSLRRQTALEIDGSPSGKRR